KTVANTGSRKHAVSSAHSSSAYLLRQRAGLSYFANSELYLAIAHPRVNVLNPFGIKYFVGNRTSAAGRCGRGVCRYDTMSGDAPDPERRLDAGDVFAAACPGAAAARPSSGRRRRSGGGVHGTSAAFSATGA